MDSRVWASAPVLCEWLSGELKPGDTVLELGSGTGAVGLYAAALGASRVVLTDGGPPALLELLAANVDANRPRLVAATKRVPRNLAASFTSLARLPTPASQSTTRS